MTRTVNTFPSVRIPSQSNGLPVEVALIAQLGHGGGSQLIASALALQRGHDAFISELDEPSARLGGIDLERGDATSLYSFAVGSNGHPFHRHAGHRVFTAISGSGGAQLRFSTASFEQVEQDPDNFVRALRHINIPPDSLFTVRFGGGTWHQFVALHGRSSHPTLFALSCHTNELGGDLSDQLRQQVLDNRANIGSLTELLPLRVTAAMNDAHFDVSKIPTIALSLDAPAESWQGRMCAWTRGLFGRVRGAWGRWVGPTGYLVDNGAVAEVVELPTPPAESLLRHQFDDVFDHEDSFQLTLPAGELKGASASVAMAAVLDGFLENRPRGVSRLMAFRNMMVKPLGLRTSPLGCPVSSLLSQESDDWFAGRFPVLAQSIDATDSFAQVVLGADDKHLSFRSCVGVQVLVDGRKVFTLGTRVRNRNLFGRFYMAVIDRVHRGYVTPAMLQLAVGHAIRTAEK
ncbi:MAG TPA: DUF2867 domain-containing protein [Xanthomonadaceae bacterium]|jgi:hypothetical protein|nr:DUF2867 domain-containing protein [Xanthomonadaceae bacterium]